MDFDVGAIVGRLEMNIKGWDAAVDKVKKDQQSLAGFAIRHKAEIEKLGKTMTVTGGAMIASLTALAMKTANYGDDINDLSQRTGIATEILSGYKLAADNSGTSIDGVATAFKFLSGRMIDFSAGGKESTALFKALGIEVVNTDGSLRDSNDVMLDLAERFSQMEDGATKTTLAVQMFGKSGMELIPFLNLGKQGLKENYENAQRFGMVVSKKAATACDEFNDKLGNMKSALSGAGQTIGEALMPSVQGLIEKITDISVRVRTWSAEHPELTRVISGTGLAVGGLATGAGTFLMLVGTLISKLGILATAFHTTAGAIAATTALYTAGIAVVGLYIGKIIELKAAIDRADEADKQFVDSNIKLSNKLYELVTSGKMAIDTYYDLWDKFEGNAAAMAVYIEKGKAGKAAQEGLVEIGEKHAAAIEEQKKRTESFIPVLDTHIEKVKTLAEELQITTRADIEARLKKLNQALVEYRGKLTADEIRRLKDEINTLLLKLSGLADMPKPTVGKAIFDDLMKIKGVVPKISDTYGKIKDGLGDLSDKSKDTADEMSGHFAGLYNDIATAFGDSASGLIGDICKGLNFADMKFFEHGINFKKYFGEAFDSVKTAFFRTIGEMVSDTILGKFKGLFSSIAKSGKDSLGGITDVAGNLGKAAGGIASGLLSSLGSIGSIVTGITSVISLLQGPQKQTDVTFWLKLQKDLQQEMHDWMFLNAQDKLNFYAEKLEDIKVKAGDMVYTRLDAVCTKLDWIGVMVDAIRGYSANLKNLTKAAVGYEGIVSSPTLFLAGERGPEYVSIAPKVVSASGVGAGTNIQLTFRINAIDSDSVEKITRTKIVPILQNVFNHYGLGVPMRAIRG